MLKGYKGIKLCNNSYGQLYKNNHNVFNCNNGNADNGKKTDWSVATL